MKRSEALKLIANQLDFLNSKFDGVRTAFTEEELSKADVILTTLESAGMLPPLESHAPDLHNNYYAYMQLQNKWDKE